MPQNKIKKQLLIFSAIMLGGFFVSYVILKKYHNPIAASESAVVIKKDSVTVNELFSEKEDFEKVPNVCNAKASSGKNSYKLTPQIEYGFGITRAIKDIPNYTDLKQVDVTFKCWAQKNVDAVYVISIDDKKGKNLLWDSRPLLCDKPDNWSEQHFTFEVKPKAVNAECSIKIYPWNKSKEEFYLDDITIRYNAVVSVGAAPVVQTSATNFLFDFETAEGLTGGESIKQTTAHSGKMACDLSGGKEYGPLVIKLISDVSSTPLTKIGASVWIYPLTENPNAVLTASITNAKGENVFWDGRTSEGKPFPKGKWTKMNASFFLPPGKCTVNDKIQVNVWNKGRTDLIIDDMEIVYGESADRKGDVSTIDANSIYEKKFVAPKNKPPFKTIYCIRQDVNCTALMGLTPNDDFIAGDFIKDKNNLDEVACIRNGKAELYTYLPDAKQFRATGSKSLSADSLLKTCKALEALKERALFKPTDQLFWGDYLGDKNTEILELNTDWRFDFKITQKDKDGYLILGNVDFKGYTNDYNPKYYEYSRIVSGRFISASKSSLLVISCNCADDKFNGTHCNKFENIPALPNSINVYSFENGIK